MKVNLAVAALSALALSACESMTDPAGAESGPDRSECRTADYERLIGVHEGEIDRSTLPESFRIYGERDMVTMDHRPDRLNIVLDSEERVVEVRCG